MGRTADKLAEIGKELDALTRTVDASNATEFEASVATFDPIQRIVNGVGSVLLKPAHLTSGSGWPETLRTKLATAFHWARSGLRLIMQSGRSIVPCSTAAVRIGLANHEAIAAAKAGVIGLTLSAAAAYAGRNIRVNCVAPGLVETPLTGKIISSEASSPGRR